MLFLQLFTVQVSSRQNGSIRPWPLKMYFRSACRNQKSQVDLQISMCSGLAFRGGQFMMADLGYIKL